MKFLSLDKKAKGTLILTMALVRGLLLLPDNLAVPLTEEGGLVEIPTAVALAAGSIFCLRQWFRAVRGGAARTNLWLVATLIFVGLALRELDFHKRFTPRAISSTGFYRHPDIPRQMKLTVVALLAPFVLAAAQLLRRAVAVVPVAVRQRKTWIGHATLAAGMLLVSRVGEKTHIKKFYLVEEACELSFAVLLFWAAVCLAAEKRDG